MKTIFEQGSFYAYATATITKARDAVVPPTIYSSYRTTVFISHKHDDLDDLKGILGFLEKQYGVKCYIDSRDPSMPKETSAETAKNIKERIKQCDKFILLATNGAIESKWCNWELGYGDAQKYETGKIALFPLKPKGSYDWDYKGSEYMKLYPCISYSDGTEKYKDSDEWIERGYYIRWCEGNNYYCKPLMEWLMR